jgi:hypothetical protein
LVAVNRNDNDSHVVADHDGLIHFSGQNEHRAPSVADRTGIAPGADS